MRTKSPQAGLAAEVVNSGQFASRDAWLPAQSWVLQTLTAPVKMVPALTGSAMMGELNCGAELPTLKPDWPPSPYMICGHVTAEPRVSNVPLSCVPPCKCLGLSGATERLWNWSVDRVLFML